MEIEITVEAIEEAVRQVLGTDQVGNVKEVMNEWIRKNEGINSFAVSEKEGNVIVVTHDQKAYPEDDYSWKLLRFFPTGATGNWVVSVDYSGQTPAQMVAILNKNRC